jgi:hypothetical protein
MASAAFLGRVIFREPVNLPFFLARFGAQRFPLN